MRLAGSRFSWNALPILALLLLSAVKAVAEPLPPPPSRYFNDFASLVKRETAQSLNTQLADFERQTSNQIVVAIYSKFPAETAVEDYTQQVARSWKAGHGGRDNAAILFIFLQDRKMRIEVGRALEGALPDALCKQIIADEIAPRFQKGDFDGGVIAGVNALIAATRGEYKGTGRTTAEERSGQGHAQEGFWNLIVLAIVFGFISIVFLRNLKRGTVYSSRGSGGGGIWFGGGGGGSSGGGGGGDGGGFSGGGSDSGFGGGGASGGW